MSGLPKRSPLRTLFLAAVVAVPAYAGSPADSYPAKPLQLVIPLAVGGDTDLYGRVFAKHLEKELGQPIVCTNITGAGGAIGARQVKDSRPDGYTLLWFQYAALIQEISGVVDFSYANDFKLAGIGLFDRSGIWVGKKGGKYTTFRQVIDDAMANPGAVNIALSGTGNMSHYLARVIEEQTGAKFNLVDLGGSANQQAALMSGQIAAFTTYYSSSKPFLESGDFIALAAYAENRLDILPDAPTMGESGVHCDFVNDKFYFFSFPKDTPQEIVDKFSDALRRTCENPETQADFDKYNAIVEYKSAADSTNYFKELEDQYRKYAYIFK